MEGSFVQDTPSPQKEVIDTSVKEYCEGTKARLEKDDDFNTKRQFLLDFIQEVVYEHGKITVIGFVPIQVQKNTDTDHISELNRIEFRIEDDTHRSELPKNAIKTTRFDFEKNGIQHAIR